ncbi:hypothetical protein GFL77_36295 [Rhizobium leguminosarum bv. viciae]|nr:hypothetical protein [Rhizobium leguminosarum bv. viciae]
MKPRTPPDSPLLFDTAPLVPDFRLELKARKAGHWPVAGADEAGRGLNLPAMSIRLRKTV